LQSVDEAIGESFTPDEAWDEHEKRTGTEHDERGTESYDHESGRYYFGKTAFHVRISGRRLGYVM
jgi:hypothetical protein